MVKNPFRQIQEAFRSEGLFGAIFGFCADLRVNKATGDFAAVRRPAREQTTVADNPCKSEWLFVTASSVQCVQCHGLWWKPRRDYSLHL